jgi:hypothetical protein
LKLLDYEVQLESAHLPYGAITHAQLTLRGRLKEVLWSSKRDYLLEHASTSPNHKYTAQATPDTLMESTLSGLISIWCLEFCSYDSDIRQPAAAGAEG